MKKYESYEHYGKKVWVDADLRGKHRKHCLCHSCQKFKPCSPGNCPIAQATFNSCVEFNTVTPVYECPDFFYGEPDYLGVGE